MKRTLNTLTFILFSLIALAEGGKSQIPLADPYILIDDGKYYAYGTHDANGIRCYTSDDLRSWTDAGLALNKEVFGNLEGCTTELETMEKLNSCLDELRKQLKCVSLAMQKADSLSSEHSKASACQEVAKLLYDLRRPIDSLEEIVDNRLWPLPKYRELLFIS